MTALTVIVPGLLTTIQDLGRLNAISAGVPPGGAMDRFAHAAANLLVGNARQDATLECTIRGPSLVAEQACVVAITGANFEPRVNGTPIPMWSAIVLARGDRLVLGNRRLGARAYVAVGGGLDGERWLGSRSTNLMAGRGGVNGRQLKAGDALSLASDRPIPNVADRILPSELRPDYADHTLAVLPGPHLRRLDPGARKTLTDVTYRITHEADRMGFRLEGPPLAAGGDELLSFGLVAGAIQVAGSGQPILLMADHQTAGGYPVVATVVSASLPNAAQLAPGDELRFTLVTPARARELRGELSAVLSSLSEL